MASQVSPGVVIRERDLSNAVVVGSSAHRGAIASSFRKGTCRQNCKYFF